MRKLFFILTIALTAMQIQAQTYNFVVKAGHTSKVFPISKIKKMYFSDLWDTHDERFQVFYVDGHYDDFDMKKIDYITLEENLKDNRHLIRIYHTDRIPFSYDLKIITKIKLVSKLQTGLEGTVEIFPVMPYPNPFISSTKIIFSLLNPANVSVSIIDERGQTMKEIENSFYPAGDCEINWDGNNKSGIPVPSGIYYAIISVNGETRITKVVKID